MTLKEFGNGTISNLDIKIFTMIESDVEKVASPEDALSTQLAVMFISNQVAPKNFNEKAVQLLAEVIKRYINNNFNFSVTDNNIGIIQQVSDLNRMKISEFYRLITQREFVAVGQVNSLEDALGDFIKSNVTQASN